MLNGNVRAARFPPGGWSSRRRIAIATPYHMTLHDTKRSREKQEEIKTELENRFLRAGCSGTITLHGDGGTVIVGNKKKLTDSLCN